MNISKCHDFPACLITALIATKVFLMVFSFVLFLDFLQIGLEHPII